MFQSYVTKWKLIIKRQWLVYKSKKLAQHLKTSSEELKKQKQPQDDDKE